LLQARLQKRQVARAGGLMELRFAAGQSDPERARLRLRRVLRGRGYGGEKQKSRRSQSFGQ